MRFFKVTLFKMQKAKLCSFLCHTFGGPDNYIGKNMYEAHKGLGITNDVFNVTIELLV